MASIRSCAANACAACVIWVLVRIPLYTIQSDIAVMVHELYERIQREGLDVVDTGFFVSMNRFLDLPRDIELLAAINRMRRLTWSKPDTH